MASQYAVTSRECGRGPKHRREFATLAGVARYVKSHWQGVEYANGEAAFHTDYSTFALEGCTLRDIGAFQVVDWDTFSYPVYNFNEDLLAASDHRVVVQEEYHQNPDYKPDADSGAYDPHNTPYAAFYTMCEANGDKVVPVERYGETRDKAAAMRRARALAKKLGVDVWYKRSGQCSGEE